MRNKYYIVTHFSRGWFIAHMEGFIQKTPTSHYCSKEIVEFSSDTYIQASSSKAR